VAVIRPEEIELTTGKVSKDLTLVGSGVVEELQFAARPSACVCECP
jgi:hypothetical protein